jgi:hypothetical protein
MMNNILLKVKNSDQNSLLASLADLGGSLEYSYPGAKESEYLVLLSVERLTTLESAIPSIQIIQIYEN